MAVPDRLPFDQQSPRSIGASEVTGLEADTRALRATDYRHGGESCLTALDALLLAGDQMLTASASGKVRRQLYVALADLHNVAGWAYFDAGFASKARTRFCHALVLAGLGRHSGLTANVCYRLGRVCLHQERLDDASAYFQLGLVAAKQSGDEIGGSILSMNSAWAWAKKGSWDGARTLLDRGRGQLAAADHSQVPDWARFFTAADLSALTGAVHTDLARTVDRRHAGTAVPLLVEAIDGYGDEMARSRAFSLILLSTNHLVEGDVDQGVAVGFQALVSAGALGSARVRDRIRPLAAHARLHGSHSGARELAARVSALPAPPDGRRP
ncbi:transcriptional regulator [Lentzea sp. NEAU-D7]|uniref:transcriptional regulator n=1 Tax=Lentzea sp. NEAU-D7 TaxID=2994667 RepID=UPI00224A9C6C|nr:transcriptional regulator [Lentzea sp. NEAU-D7]MCX2953948.1 transcriptional regulator [Lentzea sp. NEAU-D7]